MSLVKDNVVQTTAYECSFISVLAAAFVPGEKCFIVTLEVPFCVTISCDNEHKVLTVHNEDAFSAHSHTHTHTHTYIYTYHCPNTHPDICKNKPYKTVIKLKESSIKFKKKHITNSKKV